MLINVICCVVFYFSCYCYCRGINDILIIDVRRKGTETKRYKQKLRLNVLFELINKNVCDKSAHYSTNAPPTTESLSSELTV